MGDKHVVRFEPVGIEIEVEESQNILRAAAEQGVQLMHGCKEGQCAACKSFVLEGDMDDIELDRYSTFALPDYEREQGSTLLCRAHAYGDLVIELGQYDEEIIRSGLPLKKGVAEVVAKGHDPETVKKVERLLMLAEYKRRQAAPGVKVTKKNFGRDRRYPIVNRFRDQGEIAYRRDEALYRAIGKPRSSGDMDF